MPIATLRFSLPEEQEDFEDALAGTRWRDVVRTLLGEIRQKLKQGGASAEAAVVYETLREIIYAEINDYGLKGDY